MSKEVYLHHDTQTSSDLVFNGQYDIVNRTNIKDDLEIFEVLKILKQYFDDYSNKTKLLNTFEGTDEYEILERWLEQW